MKRCGICINCKELKKIQQRVMACANPPFSHADQGVIDLWNEELERLSCTQRGIVDGDREEENGKNSISVE